MELGTTRLVRLAALASALAAGCTQQISAIDVDASSDASPPPEDAAAAAPDARACPGGEGCPQCQNGLDDDGDSRIDYPLDPDCRDRDDDDERAPPSYACSDGDDDDGDGAIDYPDDPGCADEEDEDESDPPPPACANGADDDGDGAIDHPHDPGCSSPRDADESDPCPGPGCPACANGADDDGDGATDHPGDRECRSASDDDESCILVAGFEDEGDPLLSDLFGGTPFVTRRALAAHEGDWGAVMLFPPVTRMDLPIGTAGQSASIWVMTPRDRATSVAEIRLIEGESWLGCLLNDAGALVLRRASDASATTLAEAPSGMSILRWHRLELRVLDAGTIACRLNGPDGITALASVEAAVGSVSEGPITFGSVGVTALDDAEVCR